MTVVQFKDLFSVKVTHSYYEGPCPDLSIVVSQGTEAAMRGGRIRSKEVAGTLRVVYESDQDGSPLVGLAGASLRLGLRLENPHFSNFTAVPQIPATGLAIYRNRAVKNKLDAPLSAHEASAIVQHPLSRAVRPVTVKLKDPAGTIAAESAIPEGDNRPTIGLDFNGREPGLYSVDEGYPSPPVKKTALYYLDPGLPHDQLFAVIEVLIDQTFYTNPPTFEVAFTARQETLRYYLVTQGYTPSEIDKLRVADAGFAAAARPEIKFDKVGPNNFTPAELPAAVLTAGGGKVVAFRSKNPVARREGGRQRIQLSNNGDVIIANLPQPGPQQPTSDLVVNLSKKS